MLYRYLLEHSYGVTAEVFDCAPESRLEYLGEYIFNFTTYDREMSELFALKAVEVCTAINNGETFKYIETSDNYKWFLIMCNMPFFSSRITWGTSIRGAWWWALPGAQIEFQSCGLWLGDEQVHQMMRFSEEDWKKFISAVIAFAEADMKQQKTV